MEASVSFEPLPGYASRHGLCQGKCSFHLISSFIPLVRHGSLSGFWLIDHPLSLKENGRANAGIRQPKGFLPSRVDKVDCSHAERSVDIEVDVKISSRHGVVAISLLSRFCSGSFAAQLRGKGID